jgi:hypothetical protein
MEFNATSRLCGLLVKAIKQLTQSVKVVVSVSALTTQTSISCCLPGHSVLRAEPAIHQLPCHLQRGKQSFISTAPSGRQEQPGTADTRIPATPSTALVAQHSEVHDQGHCR